MKIGKLFNSQIAYTTKKPLIKISTLNVKGGVIEKNSHECHEVSFILIGV